MYLAHNIIEMIYDYKATHNNIQIYLIKRKRLIPQGRYNFNYCSGYVIFAGKLDKNGIPFSIGAIMVSERTTAGMALQEAIEMLDNMNTETGYHLCHIGDPDTQKELNDCIKEY